MKTTVNDMLHDLNKVRALEWWSNMGNSISGINEDEITNIIIDWGKSKKVKTKINYISIHD